MAESLQQLLVTNFGLSPSGYAGSRGDTGYVGSSGLGYTGSAGAGATVPTVTAITYPGDDTAASTAGGQTITLTGTNFLSGATVIVNGSVASVVSVVNSTTITFTSPALSAGSYIVYVVNTNGTTALAVPGIQYSGTPSWTTAAGTLGTSLKQASFTANLVATGDAPITYSVYSGTLPSGVTLNANTGVISGTTPNVASSTTYNFTIRSTDAQNQDTDRAFSITVVPTNPPPTVEYLVVGGGGGGGGANYAGGGGAGGFRTGTDYAITTIGSPITVVVGAGGTAATPTASTTHAPDSSFGTLVATGGGQGDYAGQLYGVNGGSGGGHFAAWAYSSSSSYAGGTGIPGQGNNGGTYSGSKDYAGGWLGGGGGGGAGAIGSSGGYLYNGSSYPYPTVSGGAGGAGLSSSITGSAVTYAGGGGGSGVGTDTVDSGGAGGAGGGGRGNNGGFGTFGTNATANTGGGGGAGKLGGSGIVVIRYSTTYDAAASTTGSPTYTNSGGYHVYKWTSSGSITF